MCPDCLLAEPTASDVLAGIADWLPEERRFKAADNATAPDVLARLVKYRDVHLRLAHNANLPACAHAALRARAVRSGDNALLEALDSRPTKTWQALAGSMSACLGYPIDTLTAFINSLVANPELIDFRNLVDLSEQGRKEIFVHLLRVRPVPDWLDCLMIPFHKELPPAWLARLAAVTSLKSSFWIDALPHLSDIVKSHLAYNSHAPGVLLRAISQAGSAQTAARVQTALQLWPDKSF